MTHVRQDVRIRGKKYKENFNEMGFGPINDSDRANTYQVAGTKMGVREFAIWCISAL